MDLYLQLSKDATERTGMYADPLSQTQLLPGTLQKSELQASEGFENDSTGSELSALLQGNAMADYAAQFLCYDRLSLCSDLESDFNGLE